MYRIIEESLNHIGSIDGFSTWEFIENNDYQGITGTLVQQYYLKKNIYKMIGISLLNGIDIRNNDIYNNVVNSRVAEEGIVGIIKHFSIVFEEYTDEEVSKQIDLTEAFMNQGFDQVYIFHPTKRSLLNLPRAEDLIPSWNNVDKNELYEEYYLIKETEKEIYLINLEKFDQNQYTIYFNFEDSLVDATIYKKK